MHDETKANLSDRAIWVRLLYLLFFFIAYGIAEFIAWVVAIFQSVCVLFTGGVNQAVLTFGRNLSAYIADILQFITYNSDDLPFPFADWPNHSAEDSPWFEERVENEPMPTGVAEPSAQGKEPSAQGKEPSADDEPSASKETATDEASPSDQDSASPGNPDNPDDPDQDEKK